MPAGDERNVVVILDRTRRRSDLTGRSGRKFTLMSRRYGIVVAIRWAVGVPVISLDHQTIEDVLLSIKAGRLRI